MNYFKVLLPFLLLLVSSQVQAQTEEEKIIKVINGYIVGTSHNYADSLKSAFLPGANMFLDHKDKPLFVMKIEEYADRVAKQEAGKFNGRVTNILSIDRFEGIATAKLEVIIPSLDRRFIDLLLLKKLEDGWKIISKTAASEPSNKQPRKALIVVSNVTEYKGSDLPAGNSFSELVIAYDVYQKAGYHVDFISPHGGTIPIVYVNSSDSLQLHYLYDADFMYAIKHTKKPSQINPDNYDIVQYTGGSAPIFDIPENEAIQQIAMHIYEKNKGVIAAVCHGTAGIVNLKTKDGKYLVAGKNVNGVPDEYESRDLPHYKYYPFIIEHTLTKRGGNFKHSSMKEAHMEVDGRLVTGQNFLSSEEVSKKSVEISKRVERLDD